MNALKALVVAVVLMGLAGCGPSSKTDDPQDQGTEAQIVRLMATDAVREFVRYDPSGSSLDYGEWESFGLNGPIQVPVINENSGGVPFDDATVVEFQPESRLPVNARILKAELVVPATWRGGMDPAFCAMLRAWIPDSGNTGLSILTTGSVGERFADLCPSDRAFGERFRIDVTDHVKAQWRVGAPVDFIFAALAAAPAGGLYLTLEPHPTLDHVRLEIKFE